MKRCPTCNQQFTDEWLTFCTQDGSSLVEIKAPVEPPPTFAYPPIPPTVSRSEQPTLDLPGRLHPAAHSSTRATNFATRLAAAAATIRGCAATNDGCFSLVLGIVSITLGWCCSFGILTAPVSVALGIAALVQIKNNPSRYTGKGMAIGGIVTGGLYFAFMLLLIVIYGAAILAGGLSSL